jgi:hypothetical protein
MKWLPPGAASKLASRLVWGGSKLFQRLGRAMLRPIFDQKKARDGATDRELLRALQWWQRVLRSDISQKRLWCRSMERPLHLFTDASGSPPYLGAVLYDGNKWRYAHMPVPKEIMSHFVNRNDNQIMGLELLGISMGMATFEDELRGRNVVIHCDNTGAEICCRKGTARHWDHAQLVHAQWLHAARARMELWVKRVATKDNIADLPSRRCSVALGLWHCACYGLHLAGLFSCCTGWAHVSGQRASRMSARLSWARARRGMCCKNDGQHMVTSVASVV